MSEFKFDNPKKKRHYGMLFMIFTFIITIGVTLAFFFADDFSSKYTQMSGKVVIRAVGTGDLSIEDDSKCNLVVDLDDYDRLIPGMPISTIAKYIVPIHHHYLEPCSM